MNDGGTLAPELALLAGLNLRNANGTDFNPTTYAAFRTWILAATATNMAYMLSAQLSAMDLVEWEPLEEGPKLFFHSYRVESDKLIINTNRIESLRNRHETRVQAMLRFVEEKSACRSTALLTYFGEKTNRPCGHCDLCRSAQSAIPTALAIRGSIPSWAKNPAVLLLPRAESRFIA